MKSENLYRLALTLVPYIGDVHTKILIQHFGSAAAVFKAGLGRLEKLEGIGSVRARSLKAFRDFSRAEAELAFIEKFGITTFLIGEENYPRRLAQCYDAPSMLFYKGSASLDAPRMAGIVGTRSASDYGRQVTEKIVRVLEPYGVTVVSGLALGIDAIAHKAALELGLPTIGVVGHGLDDLYPAIHKGLAKEMIAGGGGLLTEFFSGTKPDRHNFPARNRVVAGLCDVVIVVETHIKGGSMITAQLADDYNRDVFAVPGRTTDNRSSGCNFLIRSQKAQILDDPELLPEILGWKDETTRKTRQKDLFPELSPEEKTLLELLQEKGPLFIDDINLASQLPLSSTAAALLQLELKGLVAIKPGKIYEAH